MCDQMSVVQHAHFQFWSQYEPISPCLEFSCACSLCESLFKGYLFQEASQKQFELFGFCPLIHPILLPGKSHGQRSLVGFSPWGREESDTTERLHFHFSLSCIGRNGNPLQCPCLENPRDGRAWWAAIYGVTQSRTRLKWLSSSSRQFY